MIDQETNQPVPGALVGCYGPARPQSGAAVQNHRTDEQGSFTFYLPPGEQHVYIMDGCSFSRLSSRTVILTEKDEIEPVRLLRTTRAIGSTGYATKAEVRKNAEWKRQPGQLVPPKGKKIANVPAAAPIVRTVTGRVRDSHGRPVFGVGVMVNSNMVLDDGNPEHFDVAITDREGTFLLPDLPRRELQINLKHANRSVQSEALPADRDIVEWTYRQALVSQTKHQTAATEDEPILPELRSRVTFVDLAAFGNDFIVDGPVGGGNDLNRLPRGVHKMGDAYFRISEMMIHIQSKTRPELSRAVKGIKVAALGNRIHILHATQWVVDSGTMVGAYLVHYTDGSNERIPIVYGRNLVNWWSFRSRTEEPTDARVAWTGENDSTDLNPGIKIRLFSTTWTNPHPEKEVATIGILSAFTECDPFLVAVTMERDK